MKRLINILYLCVLGCTSTPSVVPTPTVQFNTISKGEYNQDTVIIDGNYKAVYGDSIGSVVTIIGAKYIRINGIFDGGGRTFNEFFHIEGEGGTLDIGSLEFRNCKYHGMGVWSRDIFKYGFDTIRVKKYTETDGIGQAMPGADVEVYGLRIRGAHRFISIGEIDVQNYSAKWTAQDTLPHYGSVVISCEVDANNFPRPDFVFIDKVNVKYGFGGIALYGITNFRINSLVFDSMFRRPDMPDVRAYANNSYRSVALSKFGFSAFRVPESHVSFGNVEVKHSNPYWQRAGFVIPFFISEGMGAPSIDTLKTDMICIVTGKIGYVELSIHMQYTPSEWMQFHDCNIGVLNATPENTIYTYAASTTKIGHITSRPINFIDSTR